MNEFLKEHERVDRQGCEIQEQKNINAELRSTITEQIKGLAEQRHQIEVLTAALKEQAAEIQRVSTKLELSQVKARLSSSNSEAPLSAINR